jgi:uncharacterized protein (DUF2384 family)
MIIKEYTQVPRNTTYEKVYNYVLDLFEQDKDKANSWWLGQQEELNGKAPYQMVKEGNGRKLIKILQKCGI